MGQRHIYKNVVYIEGMFRQFQTAFPQKLSTVNHRMHKNILAFAEMFCLIPAKNPVFRQCPGVFHHLFVFCSFFFVDKITDQHIKRRLSTGQFPQNVKNFPIGFSVHPVVTVHHLKIQAGSVADSCIYRFSVPAVFLMNRFYNSGILTGIPVCNLCSPVHGTIIHNDNFHILAASQQGFYTVLHIILGIIAGNRD